MKRRNLLRSKKLVAIVLAASLCMSSGVTAMAETEYSKVDIYTSGVQDEEDKSTPKGERNADDGSYTFDGDVKNEGDNYDSAVNVTSSNGKTADVTIEGNVADSSSEQNSKGVSAQSTASESEKSSTEVTVKGDVSAQSGKNSTGIDVKSDTYGDNSKASAEVTVEKNVTATSTGKYDDSKGISASASGKNSSASANVKNNVIATSEYNSIGIDVTVSGNSSGGSGDDPSVAVSVDGNVTATAEYAYGINSDNTGGKEDINVGGNVNATSTKSSAYGIHNNNLYNGSDTTIKVKGDLNAKSLENDPAFGIYNKSITVGSKAEISIDGNVNATSKGNASGIRNWTTDSTSETTINIGGDINAISENSSSKAIDINTVQGKLDINVSGSVNQKGTAGDAIYLQDSTDSTDGKIKITVLKDVTATNTAVDITDTSSGSQQQNDAGASVAGEESKVNLTVGGTISGDEHNIVLNDEASLDDVNITVWKVDTSNEKNVVESKARDQDDYVRNEKAEKQINYIIHVQSDVSISSGTRKVSGYDTARQDEKVTFAVEVPSGYEIENFYNVSPGNIINLEKSADGTYLLTVPRGGGVDIGVSMRALKDSSTDRAVDNGDGAQIIDNSDRTYDSGDSSSDSSSDAVSYGFSDSGSGNSAAASLPEYLPVQVSAPNVGGTYVTQNLSDVLKPIDNLSAINNFMSAGLTSVDTKNMISAGVVDFNNLFSYSISDTVDVPVAANVYNGAVYTVAFSDGTRIQVPCIANGILNIPFSKNTAGLTYIIYAEEMNPAMFIGMPLGNQTA